MDLKELYEERAAILEFDAGYTRQEAERIAKLMINGKYPIHTIPDKKD